MLLPGGWIESRSPPPADGSDAAPRPKSVDDNNLQGLKINIVPRVNFLYRSYTSLSFSVLEISPV